VRSAVVLADSGGYRQRGRRGTVARACRRRGELLLGTEREEGHRRSLPKTAADQRR
jgi:hypothetical protein